MRHERQDGAVARLHLDGRRGKKRKRRERQSIILGERSAPRMRPDVNKKGTKASGTCKVECRLGDVARWKQVGRDVREAAVDVGTCPPLKKMA
jgi:hypothetical protein